MKCPRCEVGRLRFVKQMTNVYKWRCSICGKFTFSPIPDEEEIERPAKVRAPKIRVPKIRKSEGRLAKVGVPKFRVPKIRVPKIKALKIREPKFKVPKVRVPKVRVLKVREPKFKAPKVREPKMKVPKIKVPKVRDLSTNTYVIFNHQNKGQKYIEALEKHGKYEQLLEDIRHKHLAFAVTDTDILGRTVRLDQFRRRGCAFFFVIPHTARPNLINDIIAPWEHTTAQFVVSQGHVEIMRLYGYEKPLHPVGWTLCPIRKFTPRPEMRHVLFAPIHPRCSRIDQDANRKTFRRLYKLAKAGDIILTVRFIKSLPESGLRQVRHPNVIYTPGRMNQGYEQIDNADVVISHQTFAWIAVARGVPTVMMANRTLKTHIELPGRGVQFVKNWDKYVDRLAYPLDILETRNTLGLLHRACTDDPEVAEWKRRMIGTPFSADRFLRALLQYL